MKALTEKHIIEGFLRRDPPLHLYELGDLDDFFFPYTAWYAQEGNGVIESLALLYRGSGLPVLLALDQPGSASLKELLAGLKSRLPDRFYCHLTPGLEKDLQDDFILEPQGAHHKMVLADPRKLEQIDAAGAVQLGLADKEEILGFYSSAYPGNWFDARMLETGQYFGIRRNGRLASIAGIHVYSPQYRVAALGNIATSPEFRGRGLGTAVTAALCRNLLRTVDVIGLNVKQDNNAAISCYRRLGFEQAADYLEYTAAKK